MAQGHMIPMIDIGKLLAHRGMIVTIISTPLNTVRFRDSISRAIESGLDMRVVELKLGYEEAGLPEGCENFDMLPSLSLGKNMFAAISNLQLQLEKCLGDMTLMPNCIISDQLANCTIDVARKLGIPRIVFHGPGCFALVCIHNLCTSRDIFDKDSDSTKDLELRVVRVMNDQFEFTKDQLSRFGRLNSDTNFGRASKAEKEAYGIIVNTYEELEADYIREYKKLKANKVYVIGPVSLCNKEHLDMSQRGNKTSTQCLEWLDSHEPGSVIYACLGSLNSLKPSQMMELALGLENSHKPFILVIRGNDESRELKEMILRNGFAERVKGERGLLIWGWAPQLSILFHRSIRAFLTHCGWNSTLEGTTAGVPLVTWPLNADQFLNEKLIVQVLGIGVTVAPEISASRGVSKEDVEKAINIVMEKGEEGENRRQRARKLGEMAKRSMDDGASSHINITKLIKDVAQYGKA